MRVTKGSTWDFILQDLGVKPKYKQIEVPPDSFYGGNGTTHQTGHVDVQLDRKGNVVGVWFRCQMLPFNVSVVDDEYAEQVAGRRSLD